MTDDTDASPEEKELYYFKTNQDLRKNCDLYYHKLLLESLLNIFMQFSY